MDEMEVTRLDRKGNVDIRKELEAAPIMEMIERGQLKWFNLFIRMDSELPAK